MDKLLVDSSFYISLAFDLDSNHTKAKKCFENLLENKNLLLTTHDFIKETLTTISQRLGKKASIEFYDFITSGAEILPVTEEQYELGLDIFLDSELNKNISLVDCIATIIYKEVRANSIITFDIHFRKLGLKTLP